MSHFLKIILTTALVSLCLLTQSCGLDRSSFEKKVVDYDPSFKKTLDERNVLEKKLFEQKTIFLKEEKKIHDAINALKADKARAKGEYLTQIGKTKSQLDPVKRELQSELVNAARQCSLKKQEIQDINKDIKEVALLIKKKDKLALTQEEMHTWNNRLTSLAKKREDAISEKKRIEKEIAIIKLKFKLLKL